MSGARRDTVIGISSVTNKISTLHTGSALLCLLMLLKFIWNLKEDFFLNRAFIFLFSFFALVIVQHEMSGMSLVRSKITMLAASELVHYRVKRSMQKS